MRRFFSSLEVPNDISVRSDLKHFTVFDIYAMSDDCPQWPFLLGGFSHPVGSAKWHFFIEKFGLDRSILLLLSRQTFLGNQDIMGICPEESYARLFFSLCVTAFFLRSDTDCHSDWLTDSLTQQLKKKKKIAYISRRARISHFTLQSPETTTRWCQRRRQTITDTFGRSWIGWEVWSPLLEWKTTTRKSSWSMIRVM